MTKKTQSEFRNTFWTSDIKRKRPVDEKLPAEETKRSRAEKNPNRVYNFAAFFPLQVAKRCKDKKDQLFRQSQQFLATDEQR